MRGLTSTHTYAELEVSADTYDEIAEKLRKAEYDHAFMDDGTIDMHGIGLTKGKITLSNDGGKTWREPAALDDKLVPHVMYGTGPDAKPFDDKLTITWPKDVEPSPTYVTQNERTCKCPYPPVVNSNCWCHAHMGNDFWFLPADKCIYKAPNRWRDAWHRLWADIKRFGKDESSGGRAP